MMDATNRDRIHDLWWSDWAETWGDVRYAAWLPFAGLILFATAKVLPQSAFVRLLGSVGAAAIAAGVVLAVWYAIVLVDIAWHLRDTRPAPAVSDAWSNPDAPLLDLFDSTEPVVSSESEYKPIEAGIHSPPG